MAIGNHAFWVIVHIPTRSAVTPDKDRRAALRFVGEGSAAAWLRREVAAENLPEFIVVRIAA